MTWDLYFIDATAFSILVVTFYKGFRTGVVNQVVWVVSFVLAYLVAVWLSYDFADLVDVKFVNDRVTLVIYFVVLFVAVVVAMQFLGRWLTRAINLTPAGPLNAILGGTLNSLLYVVVLMFAVNVGIVSIPKLDKYLEKTIALDPLVKVEKRVMDSRVVKKVLDAVDEMAH